MRISKLLVLLFAAACALHGHHAIAQQQPILCNTTTDAECNTSTNPGNGYQGDPAWLSFGKTNANFNQIFAMLGNTGTLPAPAYGLILNNNGTVASLLPGSTGTWCLSWASLAAEPTLVSCPSGGGTVTSVAATTPPWLSVSGSPVTGTGTLAFSSTIQPNNYVLASAASGSQGALAPRALTAADIASALAASTSINGTTVPSGATLLTSGGALGTPSSGSATNLTNFPTLNQNTTGTAALASALAATPTQCSGQFATGIAANGNANCAPAGNVSSSGSPAQYQVGIWSSGSAVTGVSPSSTVGEALISNGSAANPGFSASLPGVTSVNGTSIPSAATLLTNGGALGTPSSGVATNLTGTAAALSIGGNAGTATNVAGGAANELPYQTAAGTTAFTPEASSGFLEWNGSAFVWGAAGNVSASGTPTTGQVAEWTGANTVQGVTATGTGSPVLATSPTLVAPALGTPSSATLTNATGLPVASGISGLATGMATFLGTPSSANLAATVTNETGTGNLVFATSPTLVTPSIGAATGTSLSVSGQFTSTATTGTAPLVVSSTTNVPNLNASSLNGATFAAPGSIGSGTAASGAFTSLSASSTVSGTGFSTYLASPPAIGGTAAAAGTFSVLTDSGITGSTQCLHVNSSGVVSGVGGDCGTGSGTVGSGTSGQLAQYASSGTAVSGVTLGGNFSISSGTLTANQPLNAQTGTSYTFLSSDGGKIDTFANAAAIAGSLPAATTTGFGTGFSVDVQNKGSTLLTVTSTTSTIDGLSSFPIEGGLGCTFTSDGTNYQVSACPALIPYTALTWNATQTIADGLAYSGLTAGAPAAGNTSYGYASTTWSGTGSFASTPQRAAAYWNNFTDIAAFPNTGVGGTGLAGGYEWYDNLSSGWDGFRFGFECFEIVNASPQTISNLGSQVSTNLNCIKDRVQANVSMGGLAGSYGGANGSLFGFNPFITTLPNASNIALISSEVDINSTSFVGPGASKYGWNVTFAGSCGSSTCSSESPSGYDNIMYLAGNADDRGTSYADVIFDSGTEAHSAAGNFTTTLLGVKRRFLGSGTNAFNEPSFKYGVDLNQAQFAAPLSGTYSTTISAITPDPGGTNTAVTLTFGAMTSTPPMGSIVTISGATGSAAVYNGGHVVIGNGTTTTAMFATSYIPTASIVSCSSGCGTATVTLPQGQAWQSPDASIGPSGVITGTALQVGSAGITSGTATIGSITVDPQPYAGYLGGALFGGGNPVVHVYTPNGETAPTISTINSFVSAALLYTDLTDFVGSFAGAPNGTQVNTGCNNGDTLTVTSGTSSVAAVITIATDGSGHATSATITTPGAYTVMGGASPTFTTSGACNTAIVTTWLQVGWGISSITLSANGSGYPPSPAPAVYVTGYTGTINTRPKLVANLSVTTQPVAFPNGITLSGGPAITSVSSILAQSSLWVTAPASGYIDANGNLIIGATPPAGVTFSATSGSGVTVTFASATFTGTAAGDTGRVITINDSGTYKYVTITGNSGSSTTVAQGTITGTLGTTSYTTGNIWLSGTNATANTAGSGSVLYPAPLAYGYPAGFYALPSSPLGAAGTYYCTAPTTAATTILTCYNNKYTSGTPAIPASPTAFTGLTAGTYTQSTSAITLISTTVAANAMSLNGCIDWNFSYQYDDSSTAKTVAGKLASAGIGIAATTFGDGTMQSRVCNAGQAGVQSLSATYTSPTATTVQTGTPSAAAIATSSSQTANIQVTLAATTDTLTISNYSVSLRAN